jgi:hypothetical protein
MVRDGAHATMASAVRARGARLLTMRAQIAVRLTCGMSLASHPGNMFAPAMPRKF